MDLSNAFGADFRAVADRVHQDQDVRVVIASRLYSTDPNDLWNAVTDPERLPRWFLPVSGDLKVGGRFALEGNAEGTIEACQPPERLEITWEFGGSLSWVHIALAAEDGGTRLTLEHLSGKDKASEDFWQQYGPGAVGMGWDHSFLNLDYHLKNNGLAIDPEASQAWTLTDEGKAFMRASAKDWEIAHVSAGEDAEVAAAMAQRTAAFYTAE